MNAKQLITGKEYLYTAGSEPVKVRYQKSARGQYLFTDGVVENELNRLTVNNYIEEIKTRQA